MHCLSNTLSLLPETPTPPAITHELGTEVEDMFPDIIPTGENETHDAENDAENNSNAD